MNDLRKISFNHLAPFIDNLLNLTKENEQLMQQLELNRHEVQNQRNMSVAADNQGTATTEAPASTRKTNS